MTGQLAENVEDALQRTLERYAEKAPVPAADLVGQVETRYQRRRRSRMTGAAAMALVLGGTAFGVWPGDGGTVSPQLSSGPAASASGRGEASTFEITPMERLWPEAVHRIPARLQDGTEIRPQALIDGRTVLVNAWVGFEKTAALYAYDLATGGTRKITDVVTPKKARIFASGFTVGGGRILWYTISADRTGTIWSVPTAGGTAVAAVKGITGGIDDRLAVSGGRIYWSGSQGGVRTAPLAGGPAEPVPGAEKERLVHWPWVGDPVRTPPRGGITNRELRNLETGERRKADFPPGDEDWSCGITWCLSGSSVRDRNGTGAFRVPGRAATAPSEVAALDRFVLSLSGSGRKSRLLLNDLKARRSGSIALVPKDGGVSYGTLGDPGSRMYSTLVEDEHVIVDLEAIR